MRAASDANASESRELRRKASQADALSREIQQLVMQADELSKVFTRVRTGIDDLIGGTATGKDAVMHGAISDAERRSREASRDGHSASAAAKSLAQTLEAQAKEAERREEESRKSTDRRHRT